jgi:pyridoxamine 5'-phosphate oxidase|tara:strand:+ start:441 stop:1061 length:621 start_codon:yes stop_codon:yes gene_type:complete
MNQKNSLGLNSCFLDINDPIELFKIWMEEAKISELNDPNALALATADKNAKPSVRMVLLKDINREGFVFYTNLESQKGNELKENPNASMCFHWKSLLRQIRINGKLSKVEDNIADQYYNSRSYESKIGAWASKQSTVLKKRSDLISSIENYKNKYRSSVPRPQHWSGWILSPLNIEFWLDGDSRIHERLVYNKDESGNWNKFLLNP